MLSKEVSSTIFKVFGLTRPGIEPRSPRPLANTLPTRPMSQYCYMYKLEYSLMMRPKKILLDFEVQIDHSIPLRMLDLVLINKKKRTCHLVDISVPADHWVKMKESEDINKYLDLTRELKKLDHEGDTNCCWHAWNSSQNLGKETGRTGNQRENWDYPNHSTVETS